MILISDAGDAGGLKDLVYGIAETRKASDEQIRRTLSIPEVRSHVFHDLKEQIQIEALDASQKQELVSVLEELGLDRD
jgi:hypothetical protein